MMKKTFCLTLLSTALASVSTMANSAITLKVADNHWATHPTVVALKEMGKELEKQTHGEVKFQIFSDSVLGTEKRSNGSNEDGDSRHCTCITHHFGVL